MSGFQRPHCLNPGACAAKTPTTHCRPCNGKAVWSDPEKRQIALDAIQLRYAQPGAREKRAEDCRAASKRNWSDPEKRAHMSRISAARVHETVLSEKCQVAVKAPDVKARRVKSQLRTKYAWCPEDRYPEYRFLVDVKGIKPREARRMIEADIKASGRREVERITAEMRAKHERQKREAY